MALVPWPNLARLSGTNGVELGLAMAVRFCCVLEDVDWAREGRRARDGAGRSGVSSFSLDASEQGASTKGSSGSSSSLESASLTVASTRLLLTLRSTLRACLVAAEALQAPFTQPAMKMA